MKPGRNTKYEMEAVYPNCSVIVFRAVHDIKILYFPCWVAFLLEHFFKFTFNLKCVLPFIPIIIRMFNLCDSVRKYKVYYIKDSKLRDCFEFQKKKLLSVESHQNLYQRHKVLVIEVLYFLG